MYNYLIYDLRVKSYFFLEGISKEDFIGEADIVIDKERKNTIVMHEKNMRTKGEAQIYFENEYLAWIIRGVAVKVAESHIVTVF